MTVEKEVIKIVECPRDAMQGFTRFIATDTKIAYLNALLKAGFDTLDFGSFVSPAAIPQMADTAEVLEKLDLGQTKTKLLAIVANLRGAEQAAAFEQISYLGFPFSVSETFQRRNTNSSIEDSLKRVSEIQNICVKSNKSLVVYMSMGFGNPYGDEYNAGIVIKRMKDIEALGIRIISVADTVGVASPKVIHDLMKAIIPDFSATEIGVHLHSAPAAREEKIEAALAAGVRRFDAALGGFGGCPMAGSDLVGNLDTEMMISYLNKKGFETGVNEAHLKCAASLAAEVFA